MYGLVPTENNFFGNRNFSSSDMLAKSKHSLSLNFPSTNTNKSAPAFFSMGIRRLWVLFKYCLRVVISTLKFLTQISGNLSAECRVLFVIHQTWDLSVSGVVSAEWALSGRRNPGSSWFSLVASVMLWIRTLLSSSAVIPLFKYQRWPSCLDKNVYRYVLKN